MTNTEPLFPPKSAAHPTIYAYSETRAELAGLLKVGYTDRAVETRMAEHYPTKLPDGTMPTASNWSSRRCVPTARASLITMCIAS